MPNHTEAVWAAARVLHEAGCSLPGCAHGNPDVWQGDLDLAEDIVKEVAPLIAAAVREKVAAMLDARAAEHTGCLDTDGCPAPGWRTAAGWVRGEDSP